jgi:DNA-binding transcriptional ArsR family regulator
VATVKLFAASNTWAPGEDAARLAGVPKHALGSNCMNVYVQAYTKAEAKELLTGCGVTEGRAEYIVRDLRVHKGTPPTAVVMLREVGLMKEREEGVWAYYEFNANSPVLRLTKGGPRIIANVQLWDPAAQVNVEPVNQGPYRLNWRGDPSMFNRPTGFINGLPMFRIEDAYPGRGYQLVTNLPGWSQRKWDCSDHRTAYETADRLLAAYLDRLGATFRD